MIVPPSFQQESRLITSVSVDLSAWNRRIDRSSSEGIRERAQLAAQWRDMVFDEDGLLPVGLCPSALVAYWNVPFDQPDHAPRAARAALRFLHARHNDHAFMRAILQTRTALCGMTGDGAAAEYLVMDDAEDDAVVLHTFASTIGVSALVTEECVHRLGSGFAVRLVDRLLLGKEKTPDGVYEILGRVSEIGDGDRERIRLYEDAFAMFERKNFFSAAEKLRTLLARFPEDKPARKLLTRAEIACAQVSDG